MKTKKIGCIMLLTAMLGGSFAGCVSQSGENLATTPATDTDVTETQKETEPTEGKFTYKSVIIIGVDGAGAFFKDTDTPNVDRIFANGATTYTELTSNPTISAQCWGSLLTGVKPSRHQFTNDSISENENDGSGQYPTYFKVIREAMPDATLSAFCNWSPIYHGIIENNINVKTETGDDEKVTEKILAYLDSTQPTSMFVQFDSVDHAGHESGYGKKGHLDQITTVDGYIGQIYDKLSEKGYLEDTLFIVTADHGGINTGHGGLTDQEKYVFFGAVGKTINKTAELSLVVHDIPAIVVYALNIDKADTWDSYLPQNLYLDNMTPEKRPEEEETFKTGAATPAKDSENYIGKYLDESKIKTMLTFDGDLTDYIGTMKPVQNGKLYYVEGVNGQSTVISSEGNIEIPDLNFGKDSFSIALWLKIDTVNGDPCVYSNKNWDNGFLNGFVLCAREFLKFNVGDGSDVRSDFDYYYPDDYEGNWIHTILVVNREENTVTFYYNFNEESVETMDEKLKDISFDSEGMTLHLGQDGRGQYSESLDAEYDDFIVYDGAMTDEQVKSLQSYYKNNQ